MNRRTAHLLVVMSFVAAFFLLPGAFAQGAAAPKRLGHPQDWSQHSLVFSFDGLAKTPDLIDREPRIRQLAMEHSQIPTYGSFQAADPLKSLAGKDGEHRDWSQNLNGHLFFNAYPAKFSFYPDAPPSCTTDYVVFGLNNTNNANLVGLNNLYVDAAGDGFCAGMTPSVLFAYNIATVTGGHVITSPILSLDGTKIGFVESVPANAMIPISAQAWFHVVLTNGGGTLATPNPAPPTVGLVPLSLTASDLRSSPWIDYSHDTVYVGTDDGVMHKITGVFNGVPTEALSPWPITIGSGLKFSPPVLDETRGLLMFGATDGNLYQIDTSSGVLVGTIGVGTGFSSGIAAPPIVDVANGTTFVVTANYGASGSAAIVQYDTATLLRRSFGELGVGSTQGASLNLYQPAFSHSYFTEPSTGVLSLCGTGVGGTGVGDTSPWQYVFGFNGAATMKEANIFSQQLSASTAARCSGWTEFFNPSIGVGGTDYMFFGLTQDCTSPTGGATDGCVAEVTNLTPLSTSDTPLTVTINGGPTGIVIDNYRTEPQASSIYFSAWKQNTVYKLTQNGLQ